MKIVLAEKPSVARDIARVLGCRKKSDGCIKGNDHVVTWAFGHLVQIAKPNEIKAEWSGKWNLERLPMIPDRWKFKITKDGGKQFAVIKKLFKQADEIICATDAGREGEHIFRLIYQESGCKTPVKRLWVSSLTDAALKQGLNDLKDGASFDPLAAAAMSRAKADWLVGLNFTQAYTVHNDQLCTVGRVQTPTLALVVNREREIKDFVKSYYYELHAGLKEGFTARYVNAEGKYAIEDKEAAEAILAGIKDEKTGRVIYAETEGKKQKAPALFNLLNLQKEANKNFGFTAQQTLKIAQTLYETHKLITYPRTESQHISTDMVDTLADRIKGCPDFYRGQKELALKRISDGLRLGKRYVDDTRLTDHHAIVPTEKIADLKCLNDKEKSVYQLVCEQFLAIFLPECIIEKTKTDLNIGDQVFRATGTVTIDKGWKAVMLTKKEKQQEEALPKLNKNDVVNIDKIDLEQKETSPPARYNDASLLAAMKSAGKLVDDKQMAAAMKENGLGTPATRAAIIERLIKSEYLKREKKAFVPTTKAMELIDQVTDALKSPELTGNWEQKLKDIEDGRYNAGEFDREIAAFVKEAIPQVSAGKKIELTKNNLGKCPACKQGVIIEGKKGFGCSRWKEGCQFVIWKEIAKRKLPVTQVKRLITYGMTTTIKGFKSKKGKPFEAALRVDDDFKVVFDFINSRQVERKRTKKGQCIDHADVGILKGGSI